MNNLPEPPIDKSKEATTYEAGTPMFILGFTIGSVLVSLLYDNFPKAFAERPMAKVCAEIEWQSPTCSEIKMKRLTP